MAFRTAVGYSTYHGKMLRRFDRYCFEFHPNADRLTKDVVKGWFDYEIAHGYTGLDQKSAAIRSFAKFVGGDAYMLPVDLIPKRPHFTPYILTDDELAEYVRLARSLGLSSLVEAHNEKEVERALRVENAVIGVNNRDLRDSGLL